MHFFITYAPKPRQLESQLNTINWSKTKKNLWEKGAGVVLAQGEDEEREEKRATQLSSFKCMGCFAQNFTLHLNNSIFLIKSQASYLTVKSPPFLPYQSPLTTHYLHIALSLSLCGFFIYPSISLNGGDSSLLPLSLASSHTLYLLSLNLLLLLTAPKAKLQVSVLVLFY